jgi:hypothetical protein
VSCSGRLKNVDRFRPAEIGDDACPAGENIQGWLAQAQAGRFQKAWEVLIRDNPSPPFTVASATTRVKAAATATTSTPRRKISANQPD